MQPVTSTNDDRFLFRTHLHTCLPRRFANNNRQKFTLPVPSMTPADSLSSICLRKQLWTCTSQTKKSIWFLISTAPSARRVLLVLRPPSTAPFLPLPTHSTTTQKIPNSSTVAHLSSIHSHFAMLPFNSLNHLQTQFVIHPLLIHCRMLPNSLSNSLRNSLRNSPLQTHTNRSC